MLWRQLRKTGTTSIFLLSLFGEVLNAKAETLSITELILEGKVGDDSALLFCTSACRAAVIPQIVTTCFCEGHLARAFFGDRGD